MYLWKYDCFIARTNTPFLSSRVNIIDLQNISHLMGMFWSIPGSQLEGTQLYKRFTTASVVWSRHI